MSLINEVLNILHSQNRTQSELCKAIGITTSKLTNWKNRNTDPPAKYIIPICEFLCVSPYLLLTGQEKYANNENEVGRTSPTLTSEEYDEDRRDKEELINIFNNLSEREKGELMGYARHMYYQAGPKTKENA